MKTFISYLTEIAWQQSTSKMVFGWNSFDYVMLPLSPSILGRIMKQTRDTVFHVLSWKDIDNLKRLQGKKKSISAFFRMEAEAIEDGVQSGGAIVAELEADILVSAKDDIMSKVDKKGRRWVALDWFANAQSYGTGPKFGIVEKEFSKLKENLVRKYVNRDQIGDWREVWKEMKHYLKGDGKKLSLVIKNYFDGVEKILKKNKEVLGNIFYGYAKSKRMTDNSWDEQIVNNIDIYKIHVIKPHPSSDVWGPDEIMQHITDVHKWPMKVWDVAIDLEIYTREVVNAEIRTMGGWSKK